jgi:hypothetical protein
MNGTTGTYDTTGTHESSNNALLRTNSPLASRFITTAGSVASSYAMAPSIIWEGGWGDDDDDTEGLRGSTRGFTAGSSRPHTSMSKEEQHHHGVMMAFTNARRAHKLGSRQGSSQGAGDSRSGGGGRGSSLGAGRGGREGELLLGTAGQSMGSSSVESREYNQNDDKSAANDASFTASASASASAAAAATRPSPFRNRHTAMHRVDHDATEIYRLEHEYIISFYGGSVGQHAARKVQATWRGYCFRCRWEGCKVVQRWMREIWRKERVVKRALLRILHRTTLKCLDAWRRYVRQLARAKDLARRVFGGKTAKCFLHWADVTTGAKAEKKDRALRAFHQARNRLVFRCFSALRIFAWRTAKVRAMSTRNMMKPENACFFQWKRDYVLMSSARHIQRVWRGSLARVPWIAAMRAARIKAAVLLQGAARHYFFGTFSVWTVIRRATRIESWFRGLRSRGYMEERRELGRQESLRVDEEEDVVVAAVIGVEEDCVVVPRRGVARAARQVSRGWRRQRRVARRAAATPEESTLAHAGHVFDLYDVDKSGSVDIEELRHFFVDHHVRLHPDEEMEVLGEVR